MADQPIDLDRLQALHEAATPGLWEFDEGIGLGYVHGGGTIGEINYVAEGRLIVAMRNSIPALLAEVRELREERGRTEAALREMCAKLLEGEQVELPSGAKNPCNIFSTLMRLHSLWREPKETP